MDLIDLKRAKESTKNRGLEVVPSKETYPYGLEITLDAPELSKLKLDVTKISIGSKVAIVALGKVERISMSERYNDPPQKSLSIQIQKMNLESIKALPLKKGRATKIAKPF